MASGGFPSPSTMWMTGAALVVLGILGAAKSAWSIAAVAIPFGVVLIAWGEQRRRARHDE